MSSIFAGECVGGPHAGSQLVHESKTRYVVYLDGVDPLRGTPNVRHAKYVFDDTDGNAMAGLWVFVTPVEK